MIQKYSICRVGCGLTLFGLADYIIISAIFLSSEADVQQTVSFFPKIVRTQLYNALFIACMTLLLLKI